MAFSILSYLDRLRHQLQMLTRDHKTAFAAWCCEPLYVQFLPHLQDLSRSGIPRALSTRYEYLWGVLLCDRPNHTARRLFSEAAQSCLDVFPEDKDVPEANELSGYGAVELLTCLRRTFQTYVEDSPKAGAEAAQCLINTLDYDLSMDRAVEDPFSHPEMLAELDRQERMLVLLRHAGEIRPEHRHMLRG